MVGFLAALVLVAAVYILVLSIRFSRLQDRYHEKVNLLAMLLEASYGGHAEEEPETGEARSETPRRDS